MIHTPKNLENLLLDISGNLTKMSKCLDQKNQH